MTAKRVDPRQLRLSNESARQLAAMFIVGTLEIRGFQDTDEKKRAVAHKHFKSMLPFGMQTPFDVREIDEGYVNGEKSAFTTTELPLPTNLAREVSELIWDYGDARRAAVVYPMVAGINPMPKLNTSDEFGFVGVSASLPETHPTFTTVNLDAQKAAGIMRVPEEFYEDQPELLGNYIGQFAAHHLAKFEDKVMFMADGSATYKTRKGVLQTAIDNGWNLQLGPGSVTPDVITLKDLRDLRTKVDPEVLAGSAYYCSMTYEQLFNSFNRQGMFPYVTSVSPPRLDGFPVMFTGIMPQYNLAAQPGVAPIAFGDMSYWRLGIREGINIRLARSISSLVDEVRVMPIERLDIGCLGDKSVAALQLAAG